MELAAPVGFLVKTTIVLLMVSSDRSAIVLSWLSWLSGKKEKLCVCVCVYVCVYTKHHNTHHVSVLDPSNNTHCLCPIFCVMDNISNRRQY